MTVVRVLLLALLVLNLGFAAASHAVPLPSALDVPIVVGPWLILVAFGVTGLLRGRREAMTGRDKVREVVRRWPLTALFVVVAAAAFVVAFSGNVPLECRSPGGPCVKIDEYRIVDGRYYRQHSFDTLGNKDLSQPWVELDSQTYVDEVGTKLRQASAFGVLELCTGWIVALGFGRRNEPGT